MHTDSRRVNSHYPEPAHGSHRRRTRPDHAAQGRPSGILTPWAASGTFTFGTDFATVINRDDGTVVTYSVTSTQLQMTFTYTGAGYTGSRINNVNGSWSFTFGL